MSPGHKPNDNCTVNDPFLSNASFRHVIIDQLHLFMELPLSLIAYFNVFPPGSRRVVSVLRGLRTPEEKRLPLRRPGGHD